MAAPVLTTVSPTFAYSGQNPVRVRVNGSGIIPGAEMHIRRSTFIHVGTNPAVAGDGTWMEADFDLSSAVPSPIYNVRVINVPPTTDQTTLNSVFDIRNPVGVRGTFIIDMRHLMSLVFGDEEERVA